MEIWGVILAAGQGSRLAELGVPKQFMQYAGQPLYWHSAASMANVARLCGLIFVFPNQDFEACKLELAAIVQAENFALPYLCVRGGVRRQDSVANALQAAPLECTHILIHDGARPFVSPQLINRVCDALELGATAVIPGVAVVDTVKIVENNLVTSTLQRQSLRAIQTPQGFELNSLKLAHAKAATEGWNVTDDAMLLEKCGHGVQVVEGDMKNIKITNPADLASLQPANQEGELPKWLPCNGFGYDVHKYVSAVKSSGSGDSGSKVIGRPMKLGGVPIAGGPEVIAHSDGDVLLHALTDALLSCLGQGDIGLHFPDNNPEFDNIDSGILLSEVMDKVNAANLKITHVDLTVIAQVPRLTPWRENIRKNVASLMHLPLEFVNVKATTEEGLGFTGEKKGIKAVALVSAFKAC